MARVTTVAKAQKAQGKCRRCGTPIKAGDKYHWFANRMGRSSSRKNFCADHYPRASEKTTSDKLSQLYAAQEAFGDAHYDNPQDIALALRDAASVAEQVGQEYQESLDNMPDGLRDADPNGSQEKIDACESWQQELESAADEIEAMELPDEPEDGAEESDDDTAEDVMEEAQSRADDAIGSLEL